MMLEMGVHFHPSFIHSLLILLQWQNKHVNIFVISIKDLFSSLLIKGLLVEHNCFSKRYNERYIKSD